VGVWDGHLPMCSCPDFPVGRGRSGETYGGAASWFLPGGCFSSRRLLLKLWSASSRSRGRARRLLKPYHIAPRLRRSTTVLAAPRARTTRSHTSDGLQQPQRPPTWSATTTKGRRDATDSAADPLGERRGRPRRCRFRPAGAVWQRRRPRASVNESFQRGAGSVVGMGSSTPNSRAAPGIAFKHNATGPRSGRLDVSAASEVGAACPSPPGQPCLCYVRAPCRKIKRRRRNAATNGPQGQSVLESTTAVARRRRDDRRAKAGYAVHWPP